MRKLFPLFDPDIYVDVITRMETKRILGESDMDVSQRGEIRQIYNHKKSFAKALVSEVRAGSYQYSPAMPKIKIKNGKKRTVWQFSFIDCILNRVIAQSLNEIYEHTFDSRLHSFIKGKRWDKALFALAAHVRGNVARHGGIFVFRTDIASYGESIDTSEKGDLWCDLKNHWMQAHPGDNTAVRYLEMAVRPQVVIDGKPVMLPKGVPDGSPISNVILNRYLKELDDAVSEDVFYARFSDDIVLTSPCAATLRDQLELATRAISQKGLLWHPRKTSVSYLTKCGRPPDGDRMLAEQFTFRHTSHVEYLTWRIAGDGTVSIDPRHVRSFLKLLRRNLRNTINVAASDEPSQRLAACVRCANGIIEKWKLDHLVPKYCAQTVTDRRQLRSLDISIAGKYPPLSRGRRVPVASGPIRLPP